MLERVRQSLALRLAIQYALVFALASALAFAALYWALASALERREQSVVERKAESFVASYEHGGLRALRSRAEAERVTEMRPFFVRIANPDQTLQWISAPGDWVETQIQRIPLPQWSGVFAETKNQFVREPQSAVNDYAIASRELSDGRVLQVGALTASRDELLRPLRRVLPSIGAGALFLSVVLGTVLAWRATRPLRAVSDTARRIIEEGDLSARVSGPAGTGELAVLVRQLNTLLDKNATHVRVLRETLDNLAHDLRTPLTRLRGTAELALQDAGDPVEARAALAGCINESDRVLHLLEALLDVSAAEAGALKLHRDRIDLRTLVDRAAELYREVAEEKKISLALDQPEAVEIEADSIRLGQAVNNLVDNALKYTPAGGRVTITVRAEPRTALLTVSDNGPGVPAAEREAIFRRLYRSDASRSQRGLGLGLSMVKAIVEAHGGTVSVDDAPGNGARFELRLPN